LASVPEGDIIENIHAQWYGDHKKLEWHHGYIQFLFPYCDGSGMNVYASKLKPEEAEIIKQDPILQQRVVMSYKLILDFFGMKLKDSETGAIECNETTWQERYENLETSLHNNYRITRVLKSLGDLGFAKFKKPLVEFIIHEIASKKRLYSSIRSLTNFWIPELSLEDQVEMNQLVKTLGIDEFLLKPTVRKTLTSMKKKTIAAKGSSSTSKQDSETASTKSPRAPTKHMSVKDMIKQQKAQKLVTNATTDSCKPAGDGFDFEVKFCHINLRPKAVTGENTTVPLSESIEEAKNSE